MSSLEVLGLQGIRGFAPDRRQAICFEKPLTVIVGANGCGKTTVIEALKFITTGQYPPGTGRGTTFVHDLQMAQTREVLASVSLGFKSVNGQTVVAVRRAKVARGRGKATKFTTLEGTLSVYQAGIHTTRTSDSFKASELDVRMPTLLGVSKAVLEHVIFCHQTEAMWPLMEGGALKKRFDDIFDSTRYTKALDETRKQRKKQQAELQTFKVESATLTAEMSQLQQYRRSHAEAASFIALTRQAKAAVDSDLARVRDRAEQLQAIVDQQAEARSQLEADQRQLVRQRRELAVARKKATTASQRGAAALAQRLASLAGSAELQAAMSAELEAAAALQSALAAADASLLRPGGHAAGRAAAARAAVDAARKRLRDRSGSLRDEVAAARAEAERQAQGVEAGRAAAKELARAVARHEALGQRLNDSFGVAYAPSVAASSSSASPSFDADRSERLRAGMERVVKQRSALAQQRAEAAEAVEADCAARAAEAQGAASALRLQEKQLQAELQRCRQAAASTAGGSTAGLASLRRQRGEAQSQLEAREARVQELSGNATVQACQQELQQVEAHKAEARARRGELQDQTEELRQRAAARQSAAQVHAHLEAARQRQLAAYDKCKERLVNVVGSVPPVSQALEDVRGVVAEAEAAQAAEREELQAATAARARTQATLDQHRQRLARGEAEMAAALEQVPNSLREGGEPALNLAARLERTQSELHAARAAQNVEARRSLMARLLRKSTEKNQCAVCARKFKSAAERERCTAHVQAIMSAIDSEAGEEERQLEEQAAQIRAAQPHAQAFHREKVSVDELRAQLGPLESDAAEAEAAVEEARGSGEASARTLALAQGVLQDLLPMQGLGEEVVRLQLQVKRLGSAAGLVAGAGAAEVRAWQQEAEAAVADNDSELAAVMKRINAAELREADLRRDVADHDRKLAAARSEAEALREQVQRLDDKLRAAEQELADKARAEEAAKGKAADLEEVAERLAAAEQRQAKVQAEVEQRRAAARAADRSAQGDRSAAAAGLRELDGLRSEIQALQARPRASAEAQAAAEAARGSAEAVAEELAAVERQRDGLEELWEGVGATDEALRAVEAVHAAAEAVDQQQAALTTLREQIDQGAAALETGVGLEAPASAGAGATEEDEAAACAAEELDVSLHVEELQAGDALDESGVEWRDLREPAGPGVEQRLARCRSRSAVLDRLSVRASERIQGREEQLERLEGQMADLDPEGDLEARCRSTMIMEITADKTISDLDTFHSALDRALMRYHKMKVEQINASIREVWQQTYLGGDIDEIRIQSDEDEGKRGGRATRSYNYRVVMSKGGVAMDMRARCSAGQMMMAAIVIRLALAENFGLKCGVLALDEPTTNLDARNKLGLATGLARLIRARSTQANFQLIVITHDNEFVDSLRGELATQRAADHAPQYFWRLSREPVQGESGKFVSKITRHLWQERQ